MIVFPPQAIFACQSGDIPVTRVEKETPRSSIPHNPQKLNYLADRTIFGCYELIVCQIKACDRGMCQERVDFAGRILWKGTTGRGLAGKRRWHSDD